MPGPETNDYQVTNSGGLQSVHHATPSFVNLGAGWTGPVFVLEGGDLGGTVFVTATADHPSGGTVVDVVFDNEMSTPPSAVVMSGLLNPYATAVSSAGFRIKCTGASGVNVGHVFAYVVVP